jgi:transketolase
MLLLASGSELQLAVRAAEELRKQGKKIRVVSMVCMRAFENQSDKYKKSVLPLSVTKRVVIEAGSSF